MRLTRTSTNIKNKINVCQYANILTKIFFYLFAFILDKAKK